MISRITCPTYPVYNVEYDDTCISSRMNKFNQHHYKKEQNSNQVRYTKLYETVANSCLYQILNLFLHHICSSRN